VIVPTNGSATTGSKYVSSAKFAARSSAGADSVGRPSGAKSNKNSNWRGKRPVYSRPQHGSKAPSSEPATFGAYDAAATVHGDEQSLGSPVRLPTSGELGATAVSQEHYSTQPHIRAIGLRDR
jgi:hypothetical protein